MAVPFSQTTRALEADAGELSTLLLGFALLMLIFWLYWFSTANISQYISSDRLSIKLESSSAMMHRREPHSNHMTMVSYKRYRIAAVFFNADFKKIRIGDQAKLSLSSQDTLPRRSLTLHIDGINQKTHQVYAYVEVPSDQPDFLQYASLNTLKIDILHKTPAQFVVHTLMPQSSNIIN